jgi:hypothetical protein
VLEPHPLEVVALPARIEDAALHFRRDANREQRRHGLQLRAHEVVDIGQADTRLRREQVDDGFRRIGQTDAARLHAGMGRQAPEGFLAHVPNAVRDRVQIAALSLHALGQHEAGEAAAPVEIALLVMRAVAVFRKLQEQARGQLRPFRTQPRVGPGDQRRGHVGRHLRPRGAVSRLRIRTPRGCSQQVAPEQVLVDDGAQVALGDARRLRRPGRRIRRGRERDGRTRARRTQCGQRADAADQRLPSIHVVSMVV